MALTPVMTTTNPVVTTGAGGAATLIDISAHRNNLASTTVDDLAAGQLNIWRNSLPQDELPQGDLLEMAGIPFSLPRFDGQVADNVRCSSQYVSCAPGAYDWLYLLVTSERRSEDHIAFHFIDGSVDFESLRVSDFWHSEPAFGDKRAFGTEHMHYPFHVQPNLRGEVWFQRVPVSRMVPLAGLALPDNAAIHVFALTLVASHLEGVHDSAE